ncbi:hypothetical protein KAR91_46490 [Candidatus Pacearchaeota archaeon]|nr:hypothetical protein [Candidatus Pacearchaeota archaeon]
MSEAVERIGDMGKGLKLSLFKQTDGDIQISVLPENDKFTEHCVEFCTSGTASHYTILALHDLFRAIKKDNEETPWADPNRELNLND